MKAAFLENTECPSEGDIPARQRVGACSSWVTVSRLLYARLGIKRGVGRLLIQLAKQHRPLQLLRVPTNDGRVLHLDLRQPVAVPYVLLGEHPYEAPDTAFVRSVVRHGDVVVDIGANVGWYSTLLADAVGTTGHVYAFEPGEQALRMLRASARDYPQLWVIPMALSDYEGDTEVHIPLDLGNASLARMSGELRTEPCRVTTLDNYLQREGQTAPIFIKMDVEGGERDILRGAKKTLTADRPPIWMIEINAFTAQRFGYHPDLLVDHFLTLPNQRYRCYSINAERRVLAPLQRGASSVFNAIFVPEWLEDRVSAYRTLPHDHAAA
jgi:FkbM family methyltransferase